MKNLEDKLDILQQDIAEIKKTINENTIQLAVNTKQLEIHIEGVRLAREQNDLLKKDFDTRFEALNSDIKPIKNHVSFVKGALWALGICGALLLGLNELGILSKLF